MARRLTLKVTGGGGRLVRIDREIEGGAEVTPEALADAADAAAASLGLPRKRANRRGADVRPSSERVGPTTADLEAKE